MDSACHGVRLDIVIAYLLAKLRVNESEIL